MFCRRFQTIKLNHSKALMRLIQPQCVGRLATRQCLAQLYQQSQRCEWNSAKRRNVQSTTVQPIRFEGATFSCPHFTKLEKGGEDAIFFHERYLGVADGVGSWIYEGIDPGLYSRELLYRVQKELGIDVETSDFGDYYALPLARLLAGKNTQHKSMEHHKLSSSDMYHPLDVLQVAYQNIVSQGSSTCSLIFLNQLNNKAIGLHIGDSGYIIFREKTFDKVFKSEPQYHRHNVPYQLGATSSDQPHHALTQVLDLQQGDWIVLATDGLWDNLYDEQIKGILLTSTSVQQAARELGELAFQKSMDEVWESPFSAQAKKYALENLLDSFKVPRNLLQEDTISPHDLDRLIHSPRAASIVQKIQRIRGGKPDDISLIVARVV